MSMNSLRNKLRDRLRAFRLAGGGNVAITFTLCLIPIMYATGAAVDYSRANSVKTAMQAALDSTGLILSKNIANLTTTQLQQAATANFTALFHRPEAQNIQITPTYTSASSTLTVAGAATIDTDFLGLMGFHQLNITASSTISWGTTKLRVALVLDNTGSMAETDSTGTSKISALKTASHNLLRMLQNAAQTAGDVQVAIIPFDTYVKVDPTLYKSKSWINWNYSSTSGGSGDGGSFSTTGCNFGDGDGGSSSDPCHPSSSTWTGCFTDRDQSFDVQNTAPTSTNTHTYFPAVNCSLPQLMPLSYDWTALNSKVDQMTPLGFTNQPIGLVWGWHALTSSDPLNAPALPAGTKQVVILLTDGLNTMNRWTTTQSSIDAREQLVCSNMKAAGITIYTVLVMSGNSTVLQNCASDPSKYFALTTAGQIVTTFNTIGTALSKLRIAQ